jgi:VWFA-related protein
VTDRRSFGWFLTPIAVLALLLAGGLSVRAQDDPGEVVRVDTKLVELKVSVLCAGPGASIPALNQTDFAVAEDGKPQAVRFFTATDAPFDLVLLLDLSGSSDGKTKLIRESAERFVELARPTDRIAVLTFTSQLTVVAPLNTERGALKKILKSVDFASGGTNFWDALRYTLTHLPDEHRTGRRTAVVVMTDGYDGALDLQLGSGSVTPFPELMEFVKKSSAIVVPIYLDTEKEMVKQRPELMSAAGYATARAQLKEIATSGGGNLYYAKKLKDLSGVYEQIIRDLGTVYSIGYESERDPDGTWREVAVSLPRHPDLNARTRPGYYAKKELTRTQSAVTNDKTEKQ